MNEGPALLPRLQAETRTRGADKQERPLDAAWSNPSRPLREAEGWLGELPGSSRPLGEGPWEPQLLEHTLVGLRHEGVPPLHRGGRRTGSCKAGGLLTSAWWGGRFSPASR